MATVKEMQAKVDDYLDQYLRAESSITSLRFRTGAFSSFLHKALTELELHDEDNPLIKEGMDFIQHPDRGQHGSFTDVYNLVRAAILDQKDDVEYYANNLRERYAEDYQRT